MKPDHELTPKEWHDKYGAIRPRNVFRTGPLKGMLAHGPIMDIGLRLDLHNLIPPERLPGESDRAYCQRIDLMFPDLIDDCLQRLGWSERKN